MNPNLDEQQLTIRQEQEIGITDEA